MNEADLGSLYEVFCVLAPKTFKIDFTEVTR
jgi:hypothetical protein